MGKEEFKVFVRSHNELTKFVDNGSMTWQKFYEMFDLYGSDSNVWNNYINGVSTGTKTSFKDVLDYVKGIDLDSVQKGVDNLSKTISMIQDMGFVKGSKKSYEPKPLYKHFED